VLDTSIADVNGGVIDTGVRGNRNTSVVLALCERLPLVPVTVRREEPAEW